MGMIMKIISRTNLIHVTKILVKSQQKLSDIGLFGTKAGMTTYFSDTGEALPCSVVSFQDGNIVSQLKTLDKDGYNAVQIGYQYGKEKNMTKPEMCHLKKVGAPALYKLAEFKTDAFHKYLTGEKLSPACLFKQGDLVDVTGRSIGKGFQGGIKRWNMHRGYMTHGSKSHRAPGSIGMRYSGDGGRVNPGLKMPGHLGNKRVTNRKLQIICVNKKLDAVMLKGSLPGKPGSVLRLSPSKIVGEVV